MFPEVEPSGNMEGLREAKLTVKVFSFASHSVKIKLTMSVGATSPPSLLGARAGEE